MNDLPRITIITPSLNEADALNLSLNSVLAQRYPNLEYMIIDGGSTDDSREIIESHAEQLHWWCSQKDEGPAHALNKGLDKSTGDIISVLMPGATFLPNTLNLVSQHFQQNPKTDFLYGKSRISDCSEATPSRHFANILSLDDLLDLWNVWWTERRLFLSEFFWSRKIFLKVRAFRENLPKAYVFEYFTRIFQVSDRVERVDSELCQLPIASLQNLEPSFSEKTEQLRIIEPILWNPKVKLSPIIRRQLQADWLYEFHLKKLLGSDSSAESSALKFWWEISRIIVSHPKIAISERFQNRIRELRSEPVASPSSQSINDQ